jgi:hypothetical protein
MTIQITTNIELEPVPEATIIGRAVGTGTGPRIDLTATQVRAIINVEDGAEVNNISDTNATALTSGGDADALHTHAKLLTAVATDYSLQGDGTAENPLQGFYYTWMDSGSNDILNSHFSTDASEWVLEAGWAWAAGPLGTGVVVHTPGSAGTVYQLYYGLTFPPGVIYNCAISVTLIAGTLSVSLGQGSPLVISATGEYTAVQLRYIPSALKNVILTPSSDFDGYVEYVTAERVMYLQDSPIDGKIYNRTLGAWVEAATGAGINELTGDGTAGPGTGSQVFTLANKVTMTAASPVEVTGTPTVISTGAVEISLPAATAANAGHATAAQIAKLDGVAAGAQVNNISDANAATLTNGENADALHSHACGDKYAFNARLTLETGVPFSVTDQVTKHHIFLTQVKGDQVAVYSNATWTSLTLAADLDLDITGYGRTQAYTNDPAAGANVELNMVNTVGFLVGDVVTVSSSAGSEQTYITVVHANTHITVAALALNHTTTNPLVTGGLPYDIYVYDNAGSLAIEALAWTDGATRATELTLQNGVYVKTGDTTRRFAGAFSTSPAELGTTDDAIAARLLWNYYNQFLLNLYGTYSATHTYSGTYRPWGASSVMGTSRVNFFLGLTQKIEVAGFMTTVYVTGGENLNSVGIDSLTTPATNCNSPVGATTTNAIYTPIPTNVSSALAPGTHYLQAIEFGRPTSVSQRAIACMGKWWG